MNILNLSKFCVLCLRDNDKHLQSVIRDKSDVMIEFLISSDLLELAPNNPEFICSSCHCKLNSFYTFKQMCLENGRRLKYYIKHKLESINRSNLANLAPCDVSTSSSNISNEFELDEDFRISGITEQEIKNESFTLVIDDTDDEEPVTITEVEEDNEEEVLLESNDENKSTSEDVQGIDEQNIEDQSIPNDTLENNEESDDGNVDIKEEFMEVSDDDNRSIYTQFLYNGDKADSDNSEEIQTHNSTTDDISTRLMDFHDIENETSESSENAEESKGNKCDNGLNISKSCDNYVEQNEVDKQVSKQLILDTILNKTIDNLLQEKTKDSESSKQVSLDNNIEHTVTCKMLESTTYDVLENTTKETFENTTNNGETYTKLIEKTNKNKNSKRITKKKRRKKLHVGTNKNDIYDCNTFLLPDNVIRRQTETSEEFRFLCTFCDKTYKSKGHLNRHVKTHSETKPPELYRCDVCQKVFGRKQNLIRHTKTHLENISPCLVCDLLINNDNMTKHLKQHELEEINNDNEDLEHLEQNEHETMNVGNKNAKYKCTDCQKLFTKKSSLSNHVKTHKIIKIKMFGNRKKPRDL